MKTSENKKTEVANKAYLELLRKISQVVKEAELELRKFQEETK